MQGNDARKHGYNFKRTGMHPMRENNRRCRWASWQAVCVAGVMLLSASQGSLCFRSMLMFV